MRRNLLLAMAALLLAPLLPLLSVSSAHATLVPVIGPLPSCAPGPAAPAATVHPRLLFSAADLPALRQRVAGAELSVVGRVEDRDVPKAAWKRLKEKAEGHLTRVSPDVVRANVEIPLKDVRTPLTPNGVEGQGLQKAYTLQGEMTSYLIELGLAYQISQDCRYGRHAIELMKALGDAGWPFWTGGVDLGIGDLNMGLGLAFDWTYELMSAEERTNLVRAMTAHQDHLFVRSLFEYHNEASEYKISNWSGVLGGGTGLLLLAIRGEPEAPSGYTSPEGPQIPNRAEGTLWPERHYTFDDYLDKSILKAGNYFRFGFDEHGAGHEGHTYSNYGLDRAVPFAMAVQREGLADLLTGTGARNIARWRAFEQLPGEGQNMVNINDSARTVGSVGFESLMFAIAPDNGVAQWNWRRTVGELGEDYYNDPYYPAPVADELCPIDRWHEAPLVAAACPPLLHLAAQAWAILYYRTPDETPEVDPETVGPLSVHYDSMGLVDARTGFAGRPGDPTGGVNETLSTFQARRHAREGHFQYDGGHFTLYGEGGRWAIDPGSACISCGYAYGAGPAEGYPDFHNVILVDGSKLTQSHLSRYYDGVTVDHFVNGPNVSLTHADMRYAYSGNPSVSFDPPFAGRDHLFSRVPGRPVVIGIADELERDAIPFPRTYTWQMITDRSNLTTATGSGFTVKAPSGATLVGSSARNVDPTTASPVGDATFQVDPIFFSNVTDDYGPHFKISTSTGPQQKLEQVTVMALTPADAEPAITSVLRLNGANAVAVDWTSPSGEQTREVFLRRVRSASAVSGEIETDARVARFLKDEGESLVRDGRSLSGYDREYVQVFGSAATVMVSGDAAQAIGAAGNVYRVYAPQDISTVTVNGVVSTPCRSGDYLTFPCSPTQLALQAPATAPATDDATLSAVLTGGGTGLGGRSVTFSVGSLKRTAVTDSTGRAEVALPLHLDPGSYPSSVTFAGGGGQLPSSGVGTLDVTADQTGLAYTGSTAGRGDTVEASALLTEDAAVPLAGRALRFTMQGRTVTAVTDAAGRARAVLTAPAHGRTQNVTVAYTGETRYAPSTTTATVTWGGLLP